MEESHGMVTILINYSFFSLITYFLFFCSDAERIQSEVQEELNKCFITPIFPESKDFTFLLANKFET